MLLAIDAEIADHSHTKPPTPYRIKALNTDLSPLNWSMIIEFPFNDFMASYNINGLTQKDIIMTVMDPPKVITISLGVNARELFELPYPPTLVEMNRLCKLSDEMKHEICCIVMKRVAKWFQEHGCPVVITPYSGYGNGNCNPCSRR